MWFQNLISYRCWSQTRTPKNQIPLLRRESGALFFKIVSFRPATPGPSEPDLRQSNSLIAARTHARIRTYTHTLLLAAAACCYCYGEARLRRAICNFSMIFGFQNGAKIQEQMLKMRCLKTIHFWIDFNWNSLRFGLRKWSENSLFFGSLSKKPILWK